MYGVVGCVTVHGLTCTLQVKGFIGSDLLAHLYSTPDQVTGLPWQPSKCQPASSHPPPPPRLPKWHAGPGPPLSPPPPPPPPRPLPYPPRSVLWLECWFVSVDVMFALQSKDFIKGDLLAHLYSTGEQVGMLFLFICFCFLFGK